MIKIHKEIFTSEQNKLLPLVRMFSKNFYLVGGTAIALHLGHRRSIDFDLFSKEKFGNQSILNKILSLAAPDEIIVNKLGELTLIVQGVKFTFFHYPYTISCPKSLGDNLKMPDLLTLSAMKAFALGQRAKWKDYVDLYFILKDYFSVSEISRRSREIFDGFNEKLFRGQLAYFEGINYEEEVEYLPGFKVSDKIVKKALTEFSLQI
ncbi:MAG: nucleotidyl transferase AbiEii/AbiGii toxin family protein [Patescibacteria group bacterium]